MPDLIDLLEPTVLQGVQNELPRDESLVLLNRVPVESYPDSQRIVWDIISGSRQMGRPNVPNSEAHIIPKHGRKQGNSGFIYFREKAIFEPTELYWERSPGNAQEIARAEQKVLASLQDLNVRMNNFMEYTLWAALKGRLVLDFPDVNYDVDFQVPDSHHPSPSVPWDAATPQDIIDDFTAWTTLISAHGRVTAEEVYSSPATLRYVVNAFAGSGGTGPVMISDSMRDEYFRTGTLTGFMGLTWNSVNQTFEDADGNLQPFLPDNTVILGNFTTGRPLVMYQGRTADLDAPQDHVGPFTKSWNLKDPSAHELLLENRFMGVLHRPESFVYIADVTQ